MTRRDVVVAGVVALHRGSTYASKVDCQVRTAPT
jgi:hypothetical protein